MISGTVLDFEHFAIHDGPGIRIVVFLKGCPLRCIWCHTPESQHREQELLFYEDRCIGCGCCGNVFDKLPLASPSQEQLDAVSRCPVRAVSVAGKEMTVDAVAAELEKEIMFFNESVGGLTISGGEPLFQFEFTLELAKRAKELGTGCCIETCGYGKFEHLKQLMPYTDIFLYDYKATAPELHRKLTGVDNSLILENLRKLNASGAKIILRCPLVPGVNDQEEHLCAIAAIANELEHVEAIHIEPFHPMARGKYQALKRSCPGIPEEFPSADTIEHWKAVISAHTGKQVLIP